VDEQFWNTFETKRESPWKRWKTRKTYI
jgi:hypothetical protein